MENTFIICLLWRCYLLPSYYSVHVRWMEDIQYKFFIYVKWKLPHNLGDKPLKNLRPAPYRNRRSCLIQKRFLIWFNVMCRGMPLEQITVPLFHIDIVTQNYVMKSPLNTLMRVCNAYNVELDFFRFASFDSFKVRVDVFNYCNINIVI